MINAFYAIRSLFFYLGYGLSLFWFSTTGILFFSFLPYKFRSNYVLLWNRFLIFWLKVCCGLGVEVLGSENIPARSYVALAKHQSQWETYFLQVFLAPISIVLKRELLNIPFFGWGLRLTDPIAIDRGSPKQALKQTLSLGKEHISNHISVLIFPEGTRTPLGEKVKFARGGANIAVASDALVLPIAHNAGEFWPHGSFIKYPGVITVKIGNPISTSTLTSADISDLAKEWIDNEVERMAQRK
jgi:1-acyl-sn-glycerol-3-phosphate acyltransferase